MTSDERAGKMLTALIRLAQSCEAEIAGATAERATELREEIAYYLTLMYPLAITLDYHLPSALRPDGSTNDQYTFLLDLLRE